MDLFYQNTSDYTAFKLVNALPEQWNYVRAAILETLEKKPLCRILEFGAGKSGFPGFVEDLKPSLHYTAQDVTRANEAHLLQVADAVHFSSIGQIEGEFDVIFSTFVFEHVSDPRQTLEKLFSFLTLGGKLFIFCPRYDFPFYLSHSADHYSALRRLGIGVWLALARLWSCIARRSLFLVHTDPAIFHLPAFYRDRDAIHWASLWDLEAFFRGRGRLKRLKLASGGIKDWIVKNLLQINVAITREK
ncbi:MAG: class I SAM-dependent methyltransferase [Verrucomicrobia bacterium]|nr:class I SAM-dependent methyltransferase [Verrucomicrobiota bacterium]